MAAVEFGVGDGNGVGGEAKALEGIPAVFDLRDLGHVGHGAAGVEIGEDDLLSVMPENVGALGHEVDAAKEDVAGVGFGCGLGEFVAIAGEVGKTNDFVALVVVAEDDGGVAELGARGGDAVIHGVVGELEVVFETAGTIDSRRGRDLRIEYEVHCVPPSVRLAFEDTPTGMFESLSRSFDSLTAVFFLAF